MQISIEKERFSDEFKKHFKTVPPGLADLLSLMNTGPLPVSSTDTATTVKNKLAYFLATIKWETNHTMKPIHEIGSPAYFERRYGPGTTTGKNLGNNKSGDGARFAGRGYVQITGRNNYRTMGKVIGEDLVATPDLALVPDHAYRIAVEGMIFGYFTGRRLRDYFINGDAPEFVQARRIINGVDHATDIAGIAKQFVAILDVSLTIGA